MHSRAGETLTLSNEVVGGFQGSFRLVMRWMMKLRAMELSGFIASCVVYGAVTTGMLGLSRQLISWINNMDRYMLGFVDSHSNGMGKDMRRGIQVDLSETYGVILDET
jgi:hypothetical protein